MGHNWFVKNVWPLQDCRIYERVKMNPLSIKEHSQGHARTERSQKIDISSDQPVIFLCDSKYRERSMAILHLPRLLAMNLELVDFNFDPASCLRSQEARL